eukprot:jgi/Chrzof1/7087/Cz02g10110.t1
MMTTPVLRRPDFDKEFVLETDASKYALGAILGQCDDVVDPLTGRKTSPQYVIAYASKNTTKPEQNYSITELECLAVVWGVKLFRPYLIGRKSKIVTDHHALIWLMNTKDLTGRLARWSLKLQEYDFDIIYRKGKEHGNVDALSRLGYMDKHINVTQGWRVDASTNDQETQEDLEYYALEAYRMNSVNKNNDQPSLHPTERYQEAYLTTCEGEEYLSDYDFSTYEEMYIVDQGSTTDSLMPPITKNDHIVKRASSSILPATQPSSPNQHSMDYNTNILSCYASLSEAPTDRLLIERGPWSCMRVFTQLADLPNTYKSHSYDYARQQAADLSRLMPHVIIYLDTNPEICWHRIQTRGRGCQLGIKLEQLRALHRMYEVALKEFPGKVIKVSTQNKTPSKIAKEVATELQLLVDTDYARSKVPYSMYLPNFNVALQKHTSIFHKPVVLQDFVKDLEEPVHIYAFEEKVNMSGDDNNESDVDEILDHLRPIMPYHNYFDSKLYAPMIYNRRVGGKFCFSQAFLDLYVAHFGDYTKDPRKMKFDAHEAIHVLSKLGCHASNGPDTNIAVALVPRSVLQGVDIVITPEGYEKVVIEADKNAMVKVLTLSEELKGDDLTLQRCFEGYECVAKCDREKVMYLHSDGSITNSPPMYVHPEFDSDLLLDLQHILMMECEENDDTLATGTLPTLSRMEWGGGDVQGDIVCRNTSSTDTSKNDKDEDYEPSKDVSSTSASTGQPQSVTSDLPCEICLSPDDDTNMILCDKCGKGYHTYCLQPELTTIPEGDWYCPACKIRGKYKAQEQELTRDQIIGPMSQPRETWDNQDMGTDNTWNQIVRERVSMAHKDVRQDTAVMRYLETANSTEIVDHGDDDDENEEIRKEIKRVKKRAKGYVLRNGQLFRKPTTRHPYERRVPTEQERIGIINDFHYTLGHLGHSKVACMVSERFYWWNMTKQIKDEVLKCEACKGRKTLFKKNPELQPLTPVPIWSRVSIDTMGPYPKTSCGNKYTVVAVDHFSKWVEARPISDKKAGTMAKFFMEDVIARHSLPKECISDNGGEFEGEFDKLLDRFGIRHRLNSAYHPSSNGMAERTVQNILHSLQRAVGEEPATWDQELPYTLMGLRVARQESTGYSPFMMLYGRQARLVNELSCRPAKSDEHSEQSEKETSPQPYQFIHDREELLNMTAAKALKNIGEAQLRQCRSFKRRHGHNPDPANEMPVGSLVLMKCRAVNKLGKTTEGPYRVKAYNEAHTRMELEDGKGKTWAIHVTRVAPFDKPNRS